MFLDRRGLFKLMHANCLSKGKGNFLIPENAEESHFTEINRNRKLHRISTRQIVPA